MAELWDEGRVMGLNAYEEYVKQVKSTDPDAVPASPKEWLSSSIAMGTSLVLRVPADLGTYVGSARRYRLDIQLPTNTRLRAANTIYASYFDGEGLFESGETIFPYKVQSYGWMLGNDPDNHPSGSVADPAQLPMSSDISGWMLQKRRLRLNESYPKILDGILLQAGTWTPQSATEPVSAFTPDLSVAPVLRLELTSKIQAGREPYIILTGFTDSSVLNGTAGMDSWTTADPQDGDYLGPAVFPWAAKVIFTVPNLYLQYLPESVEILVNSINYNDPYSHTQGPAQLVEFDQSGDTFKALSLTDEDGVDYTISENPNTVVPSLPSSPSTIEARDLDHSHNIIWSMLLNALARNEAIDILGYHLKSIKEDMPNGYITFHPGTNAAVRLYISKTEPLADPNIPDGSIGIGW